MKTKTLAPSHPRITPPAGPGEADRRFAPQLSGGLLATVTKSKIGLSDWNQSLSTFSTRNKMRLFESGCRIRSLATSHSPLITSHCISNRSYRRLELNISPTKQRTVALSNRSKSGIIYSPAFFQFSQLRWTLSGSNRSTSAPTAVIPSASDLFSMWTTLALQRTSFTRLAERFPSSSASTP